MIETAVFIGVLLSLLSWELLGVAAGGMISAGYLALYLDQPTRVIATFAIGTATWFLVAFVLERMLILYGRRKFAATLIVGLILTLAVERAWGGWVAFPLDLRPIGIIIPGLIAHEMSNQGFLATVGVTLAIASITRFLVLFLVRSGIVG